MRLHRSVGGLVVAVVIAGCTNAQNAAPSNSSLPPIVFVRGIEQIYLLNNDGSVRFVTQGGGPKWFPDHKQLLFLRVDRTRTPVAADVWRIRPDGTGAKQVSFSYPQQARFYAVDASTGVVVYADNQGISAVNVDGSVTRSVLRDPSVNDVVVSHHGSRIAYVDNSTPRSFDTLRIIDINGSGRHVVFSGTGNTCAISAPNWSPDDRWIVFYLCTDKGGDNRFEGLWLIHPNGRGLHLLTANGYDAAWSPDGRWIAYTRRSLTDPENKFALFKSHPDGSGRVQLTPDGPTSGRSADGSPSW